MTSEPKTIKESKSKIAIKSAARELFWKHGIRRITVDEIAQRAELSKMTFYRNFDNKIDLALELMQDEVQLATTKYSEIMHRDLPFIRKMKLLIQFQQSRSKNMSMEFVKDLYSKESAHSKIIDFLHQASAEHISQLSIDFKLAQDCGDIRSDIPIKFIIHMLNLFAVEKENPALIDLFDSADEMSTAMTNFFMSGIINHNPQ